MKRATLLIVGALVSVACDEEPTRAIPSNREAESQAWILNCTKEQMGNGREPRYAALDCADGALTLFGVDTPPKASTPLPGLFVAAFVAGGVCVGLIGVFAYLVGKARRNA